MRHRSILTMALVLPAACAPAESDPLATAEQPIIGGSPDTGKDLGLPLLIIRDANGRHYASCSASMITRKVVMTAAHCADMDNMSYEVWFTDAYNVQTKEFTGLVDDTRRVAVARWVHPMWQGEDAIDKGYDIALLALDHPMPDSVAPLPYNRERMHPARNGETLRIAGFGERVHNSDSPDYIKMTAKNTITEINNFELQIEGRSQIIAAGDSGGPAFVQNDGHEFVAGVSSYGITFQNSSDEASAFTRVDLYLPEIDAFIAANDPQTANACDADGVCGTACPGVDPDCPCIADGQCTTACAQPDRDPDCPVGCLGNGVCVRTGCAEKDPDCGEKPMGMTCASNSECASDLCVVDGKEKVCVERCGTDRSCADGFACASPSNVCLPSEGGGCAVAPSRGASPGGWLALLLAGLAGAWRRRRA